MFLERLLNLTNAPLLEQVARFTSARQSLIAENIANIDTPGYLQKDLSVSEFYSLLRERTASRSRSGSGSVRFDDIAMKVENPRRWLLFHDGNNRSMEHLASDMAKNAMMHNLAIELLRKQYQTMESALRERVT